MSAAAYYSECDGETSNSQLSEEAQKETQAKFIEENVLLLQTHARGYLTRQRDGIGIHQELLDQSEGHQDLTDHGLTGRSQQVHRETTPASCNINRIETTAGQGQALVVEENTTTSGVTSDRQLLQSHGNGTITGCTQDDLLRQLETAARWPTPTRPTPWWVDTPDKQQSTELCAVCSHINFDVLLHTMDSYMYEPAIPLGNLHDILEKSDCPFCRLVTHQVSILLGAAVKDISRDPDTCFVQCEIADDPNWARSLTRIRQICLGVSVALPGQSRTFHRYGQLQQVLQAVQHPPEQRFNDVRLVKDQIDIDLIKSWIQTCETDHGSQEIVSNTVVPSFKPTVPESIHSPDAVVMESCHTQTRKLVFQITVIDVLQECLVEVPSTARYITLSYVWGGPQVFQNILARKQSLYRSGGISSNNVTIPKTIRDAIQLVTLLGERYLWVDSLCICQDDPKHKMDQIRNMGNIYGMALFTVVAAYGDNANSGLPGVTPQSRKVSQRTEVIQNMLLSNEARHLEHVLPQSHWNTRGWTYQENELSNRCLIFTQDQVYFRCNRGEFKEDSGLRDIARGFQRSQRIRGQNSPIWHSYSRAVRSFTRRNFTLATDVIPAFEGVASLFQPAFGGSFLFGLPETELDAALLWQPISPTDRRVDANTKVPLFPSWSWAGWTGEAGYIWPKYFADDVSRVEWQFTTHTNGQINTGSCTSNELRAPKSDQHPQWKQVNPHKLKGIPHYYQVEKPTLWCLHPVAPKNERLTRSLVQPPNHQLTFKAYVTRFGISGPVHAKCSRDSVSCCTSSTHVLCPHEILDDDGFPAGTVYLPSSQSSVILLTEKYEIVCLSRRRSGRLFDSPSSAGSKGSDPSTEVDNDFKTAEKLAGYGKAKLYPVSLTEIMEEPEFDPRRYNMFKPWPLYNVMMIGRQKDANGQEAAYRLGIGLIHVTAFLLAQPVKRLITLI